MIRFGAGADTELLIAFHANESEDWREADALRYTAVASSGCFGLQVDGARFSYDVVFEAR